MNQEQLDRLRKKLAQQTADLVNVAGLEPLVLATLLLDTALALTLQVGVPPAEIAASLRAHAIRLEELEGDQWPGGKIPEA
ncbi:MAG: hypothetical protein O6926_07970 [candidate division NC10 bacterium]|nr:hypothetical protein [candidate division NC10 bacterium]